MQYIVLAEVDLDGETIDNCNGITLKQRFNEHHEFTIRLDFDVIESSGASLSLQKGQKKIGKTVIIRYKKTTDEEPDTAYEFRGIVCEVRLETSNRNTELVISGYSPTIILENGQHLASFLEFDLEKIVKEVSRPLSSASCQVSIQNKFKTEITYICQYRESAFHFLNRLSAEFGEYFYYDGKNLNFGKPSQSSTIEIANGEDVDSMQLALRLLPVNFANYSYHSKDDKFFESTADGNVPGIGQYASHVLKESKNLFSEKVTIPSRGRVESKSDLDTFTGIQKSAIAANMEVLTATSFNPSIAIGSVVNLKISIYKDGSFTKEDYGKFVIISIEHFVTDGGNYYNSFEAIPADLEVIPVTNVIMPLAETQVAIVIDNDDPDKKGRVKVEMLWQKALNETTDWIRVMSPDAGAGDGKNSEKNRGHLCIPEIGDQVLVGFRYNDPDRPFVLGSLYNGKTGEGGGDDNKTKSFSTKSGSIIEFKDKAIAIKDPKEDSRMEFDGEGNIKIESKEEIKITCGESSITMKKDGTIEIKGKEITIDATSKAIVKSGQASLTAETSGDIKMAGTNAEVSGQIGAKVKGNATAEISASGQTTVKGSIVMIN